MDTSLTAFIFIAIIGLGILAFVSYDSSITGQGIKITIPQETLKKVIEEKDPPSGQAIFTAHECLIFNEIYKLRKELNLQTNHLESTKENCQKYGWWK